MLWIGCASTWGWRAARAETLRRETDKALLLGCWGMVGLPQVGSIPDFLCLLAMDRACVKNLFAVRTETGLDILNPVQSSAAGIRLKTKMAPQIHRNESLTSRSKVFTVFNEVFT